MKFIVVCVFLSLTFFNQAFAQDELIRFESILRQEASKSSVNAAPDTLVATLSAQITIGSRIYQSALSLTNYMSEPITITQIRQLNSNLSQNASGAVNSVVPSGSTASYSISYQLAPLVSDFENFYAEFTVSYSGGTLVFLYQNGRLLSRGISDQSITVGIQESIVLSTVFLRGTPPYSYQISLSDPLAVTASVNSGILNFSGLKKGTGNVKVTATDASLTEVSAFFVNTVSERPQAVDDSFTIAEDTPSIFNLVDNDIDTNGLALSVTSVFGAQNGVVLPQNGTSVSYTPNLNYFGLDSFSYIVSNGVSSDTATVSLTITAVNDSPVSLFTPSSASGETPLLITFDASASSDVDGDGLIYSWDFGDGAQSSGQTAQHTFQTAGAYQVSLTVSDGVLSHSSTQVITAISIPKPPTASFVSSHSVGRAPLSVSFDATSSSDPDSNTLTYLWNFGDGSTGTGPTVVHTYTTGGTFTVQLTVSDGALTDVSTTVITVDSPNLPPTAVFTHNGDGKKAIVEIIFDGTGSSDPNGDSLVYFWNFGDGSAGSGNITSHSYSSPGEYTVVLFVSDGVLTDTTSAAITILPPNRPPSASFVASSTSGTAPLTIGFDGSSSTDPDGDELSFLWKIAPGVNQIGTFAVHNFATSGSFNVELVVSDGELADSTIQTITIASGVSSEDQAIPTEFSLSSAFPNPFRTTTVINYSIPRPSKVSIIVSDLSGRIVANLVNADNIPTGHHSTLFDANGLPSGVYIVRMEADSFTKSMQVVLVR